MSYNEHTKKKMQTGIPTNEYRDNYDLIFGKDRKERFVKAVNDAVDHFKKKREQDASNPS